MVLTQADASANMRGAAWMTTSMFAFTGNDALMKRAAEDLPLFQAVFLRGIPLIGALWLVMRWSGVSPSAALLRDRPLVLRVIMEMVLMVSFLLTLIKVPLGALAAVVQLVPLVVAFAAARLLHERVSPHRVGALALAFCGVMLVIRPGSSDFNPWFILGFVTVCLVVVRELSTRRVGADVPAPVIAFVTATAATALGGVLSAVQGWQRPSPLVWLLLVAAAAFMTVAHLASVTTIRNGDLSFSALFRSTAMAFALVLQIVVFNDVPDALTWAGVALIACATVGALRHERMKRPVALA